MLNKLVSCFKKGFTDHRYGIIIVFVCGCSKDAPESATAKTERMLKASWRLGRLTVDGADQTTLFPDLTVTVNDGNYTAQNGEPIWPISGTWSLTDATTIDRDNGFTIRIESITEPASRSVFSGMTPRMATVA